MDREPSPSVSPHTDPTEVNPAAEQTPFWSWSDIALWVGLGVPAFVLVFIGTSAALRLLPGRPPRAAALLIPQFAGFVAGVAPLALIFRAKYDRRLLASLAMSRSSFPATLRAITSGVALSFLVLAIAAILRTPPTKSPMQDLMDDPASVPFIAVAAVTLGPWFEELVFRGVVQPILVRDLGAVAGVLLAALPFGLLHGPEYAWSWRHLLLVSLAGAAFGYKRLRSGSTGEAVIMHAAYNGVLMAGFLIGRKFL